MPLNLNYLQWCAFPCYATDKAPCSSKSEIFCTFEIILNVRDSVSAFPLSVPNLKLFWAFAQQKNKFSVNKLFLLQKPAGLEPRNQLCQGLGTRVIWLPWQQLKQVTLFAITQWKKSCVQDDFLWCYLWEQKCAKALTKAVNQMDCGRDKYTNTILALNSRGIQNK